MGLMSLFLPLFMVFSIALIYEPPFKLPPNSLLLGNFLRVFLIFQSILSAKLAILPNLTVTTQPGLAIIRYFLDSGVLLKVPSHERKTRLVYLCLSIYLKIKSLKLSGLYSPPANILPVM